ncbi:hypothetical protein CDAR_579681 [Caerostris darwini]|uniref:Uncharacterized protein n=1 Tax=Caerostris darwini TaxID=1538125 RepID=A0AAV4RWJ4_9ARAC|nr:hypothetical protein CDAR_579681 [Caerostris darwini]
MECCISSYYAITIASRTNISSLPIGKEQEKNTFAKVETNECRSFSEQPMFPGRILHGGKQVMEPELSMAKLTEALKEKVSICIFSSFPRLGTKICGGRKVIHLKSIRWIVSFNNLVL